jgi:Uma2 family endonuclease
MRTSNTSPGKLTYKDFVQFPDDGRRHEIIDGAHYVSPCPNTRHQELSVRLVMALGIYLSDHPIGKVFHAPFDCLLTLFDIVEPDLLVVLADQASILTDKHIRGAPAIVIEILSPGTSRRDRGIKRNLYDRVGVREYWIVDPQRDAVTVFRRSGKDLVPSSVLTAANGERLTSPLLPGFALELPRFFGR